MATELVIEQDAALNSHVLDLTPITRGPRLAWMKQGLCLVPFWFLWTVFELADDWTSDQPISWVPYLASFLGLTLFGCLGAMAFLEWFDQGEKKASRRLLIKQKQITLYPCRTLHWKLIQGWHLAPPAEKPDLQKLTVIYLPYAKARHTRQWSIIVTDPAQAVAFHELLRQRTLAGQPGATLLKGLPVPESAPFPAMFIGTSSMVLGLMTMLLSASIMLMGMTFLVLFDLQIHPGLFQPPDENRNIIGLFGSLAGLFRSNSTYELGWALVTAGGFLLLPALALFKLGGLRLSRKPSS